MEKNKFLAGFYKEGKLLAAACVGMPGDLTAIEMMLRKNIPLSAEKLEDAAVDLSALAGR